MRGGKREGAGRPVAQPKEVMRIRLPIPIHRMVMERGGDIWVKRVISEQLNDKETNDALIEELDDAKTLLLLAQERFMVAEEKLSKIGKQENNTE